MFTVNVAAALVVSITIGEDGLILIAVLIGNSREAVGVSGRTGDVAEGGAAIDAQLPLKGGAGLPLALAVKLAVAPATTAWLTGWSVITGALVDEPLVRSNMAGLAGVAAFAVT